jgi:hypothetical protein
MPLTTIKGAQRTADLFAVGWRYSERTITAETVEKIEHGFRDGKGRTLGAIVKTGTMTVTIFDDESCGSRERCGITHRDDAGVWYFGRVQAAKNGARFGASQSGEYFRTEAERDAYVARRLADSRKAAEKQAA